MIRTALVVAAALAASLANAHADGSAWTGSFEPQVTFLDDPLFTPIACAEHGALHLEARYQYEDFNTGSLWAGKRFTAGSVVALDAVAMAGLVFGGTTGAAPGAEVSVTWKAFEAYAESEYVFDLDSSAGDFFYTWSELSWAATSGLTLGLAAQRTRTHESEREIQRGPFGSLQAGRLAVALYWFELDREDPFAVLALDLEL